MTNILDGGQEGLEQFGYAGGVHLESDCRQHWLSGTSDRYTSKQDEQSLEARAWLVAQLTFPQTQDSYSARAQLSRDLSVSLLVAGQFLAPVRAIRLGRVTASRTSVPEAAVDEYGGVLSWEEEVGRARDVIRVDSPTNNSISDKVRSKAQLRGCIGA
jgi:hypothetical protein